MLFGSHREYGEHHLCDIEGVPPVVVRNVTVIFFHAQKPSAKDFVVNVKPFDEIQIKKHS